MWRGASTKVGVRPRLRHLAYAGGWKKFEPLWDLLIRSKQVLHALPILETILSGFGSRPASLRCDDALPSQPLEQLPIQEEEARAPAGALGAADGLLEPVAIGPN